MTAIPSQPFDLYYILVELVFGSILMSGIAIAIVIVIFGMLMRMSPMMVMFLLGLFIVTFGVGYAGAAIAVPIFIGSFVYFAFNLIQFTRKFV